MHKFIRQHSWLLAVVGFVAAALLVSQAQPEKVSEPTDAVTSVAEATGQGVGSKSVSPNYTQLVKQYEGKRIQFDAGCQATPPQVTYKNGAQVMFDNRSGDARYIRIGGKVYLFPGYGFRVLTLASKTLPYTVKIDCGSAVNVGQILLQR